MANSVRSDPNVLHFMELLLLTFPTFKLDSELLSLSCRMELGKMLKVKYLCTPKAMFAHSKIALPTSTAG